MRTALRNAISAWYVPGPTPAHVEAIRKYELEAVLRVLPAAGHVLEIGAGTGWQACVLNERGYSVSAIDLPCSVYRADRIWPVIDYDGHRLPFEDGTFDIIFSSNVLEHIPHLVEFQREIHRTLKRDGCVVHVLPSATWRFWTSVTHVLKCWRLPTTHGEHARNPLTEMVFFGRRWWTQFFADTGWIVVSRHSNRLFYTGHCVLDARLTLTTRRRLSRLLGGSCNIFVLRERAPAPMFT